MPDSGMNGTKLQILVVEDESALVEILRYNLEKEGFSVATAADGEAALENGGES